MKTEGMKICTKCKKEKQLTEFGYKYSTKDGKYINCKGCKICNQKTNNYNKRTYSPAREKRKLMRRILKVGKDQYKAEQRERSRIYNKRKPLIGTIRQIKWREKNRERAKETVRKRYAENKQTTTFLCLMEAAAITDNTNTPLREDAHESI